MALAYDPFQSTVPNLLHDRILDSCGCAIADAPLENLDAPGRIPGQYYVEFKPTAEQAKIPTEGAGAPVVLPKLRPVSKRTVNQLAKALAMSADAKLVRVLPGKIRSGFVLQGPSQAALLVLAKDPRVALIEAVQKLTDP